MSRRSDINDQRFRRRMRVRRQTRRGSERPRLCIFRSGKHISAQIIDDENGVTLASASTQQATVREGLSGTSTVEAAKVVGKLLAERAKEAGLDKVSFDRGPYKYHGRVAALAQAAREGGLVF